MKRHFHPVRLLAVVLLAMSMAVATLADEPAGAQLLIAAKSKSTGQQTIELEQYVYNSASGQFDYSQRLELSTYLNSASPDAVFTFKGAETPSIIYVECLTDLDGTNAYEQLLGHQDSTSGVLTGNDEITLYSAADRTAESATWLTVEEDRTLSAAALLRFGIEMERSRTSSGETPIKELSAKEHRNFIFYFTVQPEGEDAESSIYYIKVDLSLGDEEALADLGAMVYSDIPSGSWYWDAVDYCAKNGLLSGTGDGNFSPDVNINRAMLVQVLYNWEGSPSTAAAVFPDVAVGDWYFNATSWAAKNGIVSGYADGSFQPANLLTREQMAVIFYQYAQQKWNVEPPTLDLSAYADGEAVSEWAREARSWAMEIELFSPVDQTRLAPAGTVTRAELASVLYQLNQKLATPPATGETPADTASALTNVVSWLEKLR